MNGDLRPDLVDKLALPLAGKDYHVGIANRHGMYDRVPGHTEIESLVRIQGFRVESNGFGSVAGPTHLR